MQSSLREQKKKTHHEGVFSFLCCTALIDAAIIDHIRLSYILAYSKNAFSE